jgi:hypothetical protein
VLDQSQAALPGVTVTVTHKATGAVRTVVTDGDGRQADLMLSKDFRFASMQSLQVRAEIFNIFTT